ncbi:hypothetical protein AAVH_15039 [Aphelenchoides avenae]|nr:hypothetical protein AAVH_15039 [Aphelenchus avenae]
MTQFWVCRCQTGNDYFYANLHGPVVWQTVGYDQCGDNEVRQSFDVYVRNFFPQAINLTRHRENVQHVLKKAKKSNAWPPMPPALSVNLAKCLWSQTVGFMNEWASNELSRGLRRDITCTGLPQTPAAAYE